MTGAAGLLACAECERTRLALCASDFDPVPVKGKWPHIEGWQKLGGVNPDTIKLWTGMYFDHESTGILTARTPALDIDILDPEAAQAVEDLVRKRFDGLGCVLTRFGRAPKRAILFRCDQPFEKITVKFAAPHENERLELLADGQQLVAFGIHVDTHKPYSWFGGEPGQIERDELPDISAEEARELVEACVAVLAPFGYELATGSGGNGPLPGGNGAADWSHFFANPIDHDVLCSFAMTLLRSGMSDGAAVNLLREVVRRVSGEVDEDRRRRRLSEIPGMVSSARTKLDAECPPPAAAPTTLFDPWSTFMVPSFPLETLPQGVQNFVSVQARIIGCDINGTAMASLANFSAALDHRSRLRMMRNSPWACSPRLWVLLCGDPSSGKTPAMNAATAELEAVQSAIWRDYFRAMKAYERAKEQGDESAIEPAMPPRYVTMNITVEKVADILARQERAGILVKCDEAAGWIGAMEKYSGGGKGSAANRGFWLKFYDGGPYFEDRIGRGENRIDDLSGSILGGIQPARLAELHGLTSDGLLQRFCPTMMNPTDIGKDEPTETAFGYYAKLTRDLLDMPPLTLTLDDAALAEMDKLRRRIRDLEMIASSIADGFEGFVGKLHGVAGSLTLILHAITLLHLADSPVRRETVEKAGKIVDFLVLHGLAFYRLAENMAEGDRIQRIASYVLTSGKTRFVPSDFTANVWHLKGLPLPELNKQISALVAGGWLIPEPHRDWRNNRESSFPWMPHAWNLNPDVPNKMRSRAADEIRRKKELTARWDAWAKAQGAAKS
jgi:hypothetical protein